MIPFLILGLLKEEAGSYGYELLTYMRERHFDYVIHYTKGSFYYNLQQLEAKALLEQLPAATPGTKETRYQLTAAGETEFRRLFQKYGRVNDTTAMAFYAVLLFADQAPDLMPALLDFQVAATKKKIRLTEESLQTTPDLPNNYSRILANTVEHHRVNLQWFRQLQQTYR